MEMLKSEETNERANNIVVTKARVFMAALSRLVVAAMRALSSFPD
jgi:hypothetical protein